jgi:hypothetical protein
MSAKLSGISLVFERVYYYATNSQSRFTLITALQLGIPKSTHVAERKRDSTALISISLIGKRLSLNETHVAYVIQSKRNILRL